MAESKLQQEESLQSQEQQQVKQPSKPLPDLLAKHGGFKTLAGFMPDAADMDPNSKAAKMMFLTENQFKNKRERLANDIKTWLEILNEDKNSASEYVDLCGQKRDKYQNLLKDNLQVTARKIQKLETAYRSLDAFFKNSGMEKIPNLRLMNVEKYNDNGETDELSNSDAEAFKEMRSMLYNAFERLSLRDNYSLVALPGNIFKDKQIRDMWAKIAYDYKVLVVTDAADCRDYDILKEQTEEYKDADRALQNVVVTANWLVGRPTEAIAGETTPLFIPSAGALAGKLYSPGTPMSQGAAGEKFGTLSEIKGVRIDMMKEEITGLWDNQVVPMVFSEGRVMAYNNTNLYTGTNTALKEYPIVRVFDWVKKNLMHYVHKIALENWDPYNSPDQLKKTIQDFLNDYKGHGKLFKDYTVEEPYQDPKTKEVKIDIDIQPYFAAKNFTIKLSADRNSKKCDTTD
ncbi:MAG: DUF5458 family protein [Bacteroidales bacterium]|nr:DUF5458 family protein [Bacteroidales bacterium]